MVSEVRGRDGSREQNVAVPRIRKEIVVNAGPLFLLCRRKSSSVSSKPQKLSVLHLRLSRRTKRLREIIIYPDSGSRPPPTSAGIFPNIPSPPVNSSTSIGALLPVPRERKIQKLIRLASQLTLPGGTDRSHRPSDCGKSSARGRLPDSREHLTCPCASHEGG